MYLPLAYVDRYSVLTDLYCSEEYSDCEPEVLLDMISDKPGLFVNAPYARTEGIDCNGFLMLL